MSIARKLGRAIVAIFILVLLCLLLLLLWRIIRDRLMWVLLALYATVATLAFVGSEVAWWYVFSRGEPGADDFARLLTLSRIRTRRFAGIRLRCADHVSRIVGALAWPSLLFVKNRALTNGSSPLLIRAGALGKTRPFELHETLVGLAIVLLSIVGVLLGGDRRPAAVLAAMALFIPVLRMTAHLIAGVSVAQRLRRLRGLPFLTYLLLTAAYLVLIAFAWSAATLWWREQHLNIHAVIITAKAVVTLEYVRILVTRWPVPNSQLMLGMVSLLFYITLLRTAMQWKEFRRDAEDWIAIAWSKIELGSYNEGLETLRKVDPPTSASYLSQAIAYAGVNRLQDALNVLDRARVLAGDSLPPLSSHMMLLSVGPALLPHHVLQTLLFEWLNQNPNSSELLAIMPGVKSMLGLDEKEIERLLAHETLREVEIARAILLLLSNRQDEARELVLDARPGTADAEVIRLLLLLQVQITPDTAIEADRTILDQWLNNELQQIVELSEECLPSQLPTILALAAGVARLTRNLLPHRLEEIRFLIARLRTRVQSGLGDQALAFFDQMEEEQQQSVR